MKNEKSDRKTFSDKSYPSFLLLAGALAVTLILERLEVITPETTNGLVLLIVVIAFVGLGSTVFERLKSIDLGIKELSETLGDKRVASEETPQVKHAASDVDTETLQVVLDEMRADLQQFSRDLMDVVERIAEAVEDTARSTITWERRQEKRYSLSKPLVLSTVQSWRPNEQHQLICRSVTYPDSEPFWQTYRYRHQKLSSEMTDQGFLVEGEVDSGLMKLEWNPFQFFVTEDGEASNFSGSGDIREAW